MTPEELEQLATRVSAIEMRNLRVEGEKSWETSNCRKTFVAVLTYVVVATLLHVSGVEQPLFGAVIPTLGYLLSTQSLPLLKRWWLRRRGFLPKA